MDLLLIVSGKKSEIIIANKLSENIKSIKIDEKDLSNFGFINSIIRKEKIDNLYFSKLRKLLQFFKNFSFCILINKFFSYF